jgi:hypothetical protein
MKVLSVRVNVRPTRRQVARQQCCKNLIHALMWLTM